MYSKSSSAASGIHILMSDRELALRVVCGIMNSPALRARSGGPRATLEAIAEAGVQLVDLSGIRGGRLCCLHTAAATAEGH
jgi:hypothetical protein